MKETSYLQSISKHIIKKNQLEHSQQTYLQKLPTTHQHYIGINFASINLQINPIQISNIPSHCHSFDQLHYIRMQQAHFKYLLKTIAFLSASSGIMGISLLITIPILGLQGFGGAYAVVTQPYNYFIQKYKTEMPMKLGLYFVMAICSVICIVGQNMLIIKKVLKANRLQQNNSEGECHWSSIEVRASYVLISCSLLFLMSIISFYLSLMLENRANYQPTPISWIIILTEGLVSFILMLIAWIIMARHTIKDEEAAEMAKHSEMIQNNQGAQNPQILINFAESILKDQKLIETKSTFEMEGAQDMYDTFKVAHEDNQQNNQKILFFNNPIPLLMNEEDNGFKNKSKKKKKPQKCQNDKIKQRLLEQIHRRKKKFKQINPFKNRTVQKQSSDDQRESSDQNPKISALPKTYKRYIKEAGRPQRKISIKQPLLQFPSQNQAKLTNALQITSILDNPRFSAHIKERAIGHVHQEELVFQKILKAKSRPIISLFDEIGVKNSSTTKNQNNITILKNKKSALMFEENVLKILKQRYTEAQRAQ